MISLLTELCWRLRPLARASEAPPLNQSISSGQTHLDLFLMTVRWRPEQTTEQETVHLWRDFLISGTVGSPPLENHHSVHSDSGTDWCFSLETDSHWSSSWCSQLFPGWFVSNFLSVSPDLVGDFDWSAVKDPGGSGGTSPGVHLDSVRPRPQHSGRDVSLQIDGLSFVCLLPADWLQSWWTSDGHEEQPETPEHSDGRSRKPCPGTVLSPL